MTHSTHRPRHITLTGTTNLRDIGGYHTTDGTKTTKWGVLYRGDHLSRVPADAAAAVLRGELHIHHVFDMRDEPEVSLRSYSFPGIQHHRVPIDMSHMSDLLKKGETIHDGPVAFRLMQAVYRQMVTHYGTTVGNLIKSLLSTNPSVANASLIHCAAGKDRTGWAIYVLLSLLDITEEEKRADYMLTNTYYKIPPDAREHKGAAELSDEAFHAFWNTYEAFLDAAVEEVNKLGGCNAYAKSHMGLTDKDIQKLRDVMLEQVQSQ